MCEPITMGILGVASLGTQVGVSAYRAHAANRQNAYNEMVARKNAEFAEVEAQQTIKRGFAEQKQYYDAVSQLKGRQVNAYAAGGVDVGSGSAVDVLESTANIADSEMRIHRQNIELEAWGIRQGKEDLLRQADFMKSSRRSPLFEGFGTLLTGAPSLISMFNSGGSNA